MIKESVSGSTADSGGRDILAAGLDCVDVKSFRDSLMRRDLLPYEQLDTSPKHLAKAFRGFVDEILEKGWTRDGYSIPTIVPPIPWGANNRSFSFHLHAWEPCTFLLMAYHVFKETKYLDSAFEFAWDWIRQFQLPALSAGTDEASIDDMLKQDEAGAWYDMAVGQRTYRLAYLLDCLARDESTSDLYVDMLFRSMTFHHQVLARPQIFKAHSNHGLYQALCQLAAAQRFEWIREVSTFQALAESRLRAALDSHFFASGVHKEHSPGYHYMLLGSLVGAINSGVIRDTAMCERIRSFEEALTWMIGPDGYIATIGDTDPRNMYRGPEIGARYHDQVLRRQLGGPSLGEQAPIGVKSYQDAGYVFARLCADNVPLEDRYLSYFAQIAGFHSRVHKHADHLSFVWHEDGRRILTDPGRYAYLGRTEPSSKLFADGFWYADPSRIYVESTRAHNCLEVDDKSYPRRERPFGSAVIQAELQNELLVTTCITRHFRVVRHWRTIILSPRRFLLVIDLLIDRAGIDHRYKQWFTLDPYWHAYIEGDVVNVRPERTGDGALVVANLLDGPKFTPPVRGRGGPDMQGWVSDAANSLIPATSFCSAVEGKGPQRLVTLFVYGANYEAQPCAANISLSRARLAWRDDRGNVSLDIRRSQSGAAIVGRV